MEYETLLVEERKHIFIVTLNRPEARNALSTQMWEDLKNVTLYYESNPELRVMILTRQLLLRRLRPEGSRGRRAASTRWL